MTASEQPETPPDAPTVSMSLLLPLSREMMVRITAAYCADQVHALRTGEITEAGDIERWMGERMTATFMDYVDRKIWQVTGTSPEEQAGDDPAERPSEMYTRIMAESEVSVAGLFGEGCADESP